MPGGCASCIDHQRELILARAVEAAHYLYFVGAKIDSGYLQADGLLLLCVF